MTDINFPSKEDKTIKVADFPVEYGSIIQVRLTRIINGTNRYECEVLTEVHPEVAKFVAEHVIAQAKKKGVFDPAPTKA